MCGNDISQQPESFFYNKQQKIPRGSSLKAYREEPEEFLKMQRKDIMPNL